MRSSFRVPAATCFWLNFLSLRACVIASPPVPIGQHMRRDLPSPGG